MSWELVLERMFLCCLRWRVREALEKKRGAGVLDAIVGSNILATG